MIRAVAMNGVIALWREVEGRFGLNVMITLLR